MLLPEKPWGQLNLPVEADPGTKSRPHYIYGLKEQFDSRIRYIGVTRDPRKRFRAHLRDNKKCHRCNWIRSVLARAGVIEMVIIQKVPWWARWQDCEQMWIKHGVLDYWPLTNGTMGGEGCNATPEVREKISASQKGRVFSEEHRRRMSDAGKKRPPCSEATRLKLSRVLTGHQKSEEHRRRLSESLKGNTKGFRKIDLEDAREILKRLACGESVRAISKSYTVNERTISLIKNGKWCPGTLGKELHGE